jgi:superfamily II DNA or RNA helicase
MKDQSYLELKYKFESLAEENKSLKARILELESALRLTHLSHIVPHPDPTPDPCAPGASMDISVGGADKPVNNYSPISEKVALFMSLFSGRSDVYAQKWLSKKGKSGYSPVCRNEWQQGVCNRPRVKCYNCPHKSHVPFSETVVESHLRGNLIAGVYPLLPGDTCRFLAMDFDKEGWAKDIAVIRETCARFDIPLATERSQSGNGGHVWFFFKRRYPAALARKFGTALLTHAMGKRHEISFSSYDRLFPNQDAMPEGGYGNLIALPLQKMAREKGNSVFIDENFAPWPDQWAFLSQVSRLDEAQLNGVFEKLVRGQDLGELRTGTEEDETPWKMAPRLFSQGDFPKSVEIIKSGMLYIEKKGFSQRALNKIKRLAAFKNPLFYKAQAMRLSTFGKPRVISCCDDHGTHLALPRGCESELRAFMDEHGVSRKSTDETNPGKPVRVEFNGILKGEQQAAVDALLAHDNGVLAAATAFGKTVVGARLIAAKKVNTLIMVHRQQLVSQWRERLAQFLVIDETLPELPVKRGRKRKLDIIGHLAGGKDRLSSVVDVALMQSLNKSGDVRECVKDYGMIIVDECHHVPAFTFEQIFKNADAKAVYGLTATPGRPDGHHPIIFFYCGPVRYSVDARKQAEKRPFDHCLIPRFTSFRVGTREDGKELNLHEIKERLVSDEIRNQLIVDDVTRCHEAGRASLVLTGRKAHVAELVKRIEKKVNRVFCLTGGMGDKETARVMADLQVTPPKESFVIVSTGSYIGEGFDEPRLDTLFLAMPISWKGTLQQYAGRLHRTCENKTEVQIYDYVDLHVRMLERMYGKRLKGYAAIGYRTKVENFPDSPTNIIFDKDNFFPVYVKDIENASTSLTIVSPFVSKKRMLQMMAYFQTILKKQVRVTIMTRPAEDFSAGKKTILRDVFTTVEAAGIRLIKKSNIHQKFAVIDETITWYGSINLLSFGYSEESIMRLQSSSIAYELLSAKSLVQK